MYINYNYLNRQASQVYIYACASNHHAALRLLLTTAKSFLAHVPSTHNAANVTIMTFRCYGAVERLETMQSRELGFLQALIERLHIWFQR